MSWQNSSYLISANIVPKHSNLFYHYGDAHCQLQVAAWFYKRNADIAVTIILVFVQLLNSWSYLFFDI